MQCPKCGGLVLMEPSGRIIFLGGESIAVEEPPSPVCLMCGWRGGAVVLPPKKRQQEKISPNESRRRRNDEIRRLSAEGQTTRDISRQFGLNISYVRRILKFEYQ